MASEGIDPSLLQDFLTESGELIEQLDADLVTLEEATDAAQAQELLNSIFRALHTIKGAASFLGLKSVTTFSHAAEDALNRLRKGDVAVTTEVMDAMLKCADVIRGMIAQIAAGATVEPGPRELAEKLHAIAQGKVGTPSTPATTQKTTNPDQPATPAAATTDPNGAAGKPLNLPSQKVALVEFMVTDLRDQASRISQALTRLRDPGKRNEATSILAEVGEEMVKTSDFFELDDLMKLVGLFGKAAAAIETISERAFPELLVRLEAILFLVNEQAAALVQSRQLSWPINTFTNRVESILAGKNLPPGVAGAHNQNVQTTLALDGVTTSAKTPTTQTPAQTQPAGQSPPSGDPHVPAAAHDPAPASKDKAAETPNAQAVNVEQTIRVEVGRLESLMNLVGQMVLTKNRFLGLTKRLREQGLSHNLLEDINGASGEFDRLTSELQVGVMRTRMQPLAKLFERYPRVIRDLARMTNKKINLEIRGKETEVDKSVLELLADPLVHILRNSADHGVEIPEKRVAAGKGEEGTISLSAEHQGSHVRVSISDDGKGLDRQLISKKAVERGMASAEAVAAMTDEEVFRFIFAPGFSTAEQITDLSGRGVGMDVVRSNIAKMNGVVNLSSVKGKGSTVEILIPLTVAIMPAMVVGVGANLYCVPLQSILEIVKPEDKSLHTVQGQPVMRLRDSVLPLIDMRSRLAESDTGENSRFAVIVGVGNQQAGLVVDRLIGQQEIVIKPLDDEYTSGGPFSGATISEDGNVSLILDVIQLVRQTQTPERAAA